MSIKIDRYKKAGLFVGAFLMSAVPISTLVISKISMPIPATALQVSSISPNKGPVSGGQEVTISGSDFLEGQINIIKVETGYHHSLAIDDQGNLYAWGGDEYGQIGDGVLTSNHGYLNDAGITEGVLAPIKLTGLDTGDVYVNALKDAYIVDIAAGGYHSMAVDNQGNLYAWGLDSYGQLGDGELAQNHDANNVLAPIKLTGLDTGSTYVNYLKEAEISAISAGGHYSMAMDKSGDVYTWGDDYGGQIGDGELTQNHSSNRVLAPINLTNSDTGSTYTNWLNGVEVVKISAGDNHAMAVDEWGNLYAWGDDNGGGKIGDGELTQNHLTQSSYDSVLAPIKLTGLDTGTTYVNLLEDARIVEISAGRAHSMAVDEWGNLYAWGDDSNGQVGDGILTQNHKLIFVLAPIKLTGLDTGATYVNFLEDARIVEISAGWSHSLAIDDQGNLYTWGNDFAGQTGDGELVQNHDVGIAFGFNTIAPIKLTGLNTGEVYENSITEKTKMTGVAAGYFHSLAIDSAGDLYAWGGSSYGQVGNGRLDQNTITECDLGEFEHGNCTLAPIQLTGLDTGDVYANALYDEDEISVNVRLNDVPCINVVIIDDNTLKCTTTEHAAGIVDVTLFNGMYTRVLSNGYTYVELGVPDTGRM